MELAALKERVQPALLQDFDAVRAEFVDETGSEDPRAFVRHLRSFALIPADLADSLLAELPGPPAPGASAGPATGPVPTAPNHPGTPLNAPRATSQPPRASAPSARTPEPAPASLSVGASDKIKRISMSQPPPADGGVFDDGEGEEVRLPEPSRPIRDPVREPSIRVGVRAATPPGATPPSASWGGPTLSASSGGPTPSASSGGPTPSAPATQSPWAPGADPSPRAATPRTQAGQSAPPPSATPAPSLRVQVAKVTVGAADPDEDMTTVMQWDDDSGEVDPEAATKHMDRAELYAAMSDHTELGESGSLGKAFVDAAPPAAPRPAGAQDPASAPMPDPFAGQGGATAFDDDSADFETDMVDKTDSIQLTNPIGVASSPASTAFPPDPAPLGARPAPLAPMDPAAVDGPYDPEADTIHVARKVEVDARTVIRPLPGGQTPDRGAPERFVASPPARFVGAPPDRTFSGPDEEVPDLPDDPTGRYRFVALVAHDGMARTYEATDVAAGRTVWIRLMNDEVVINPVLLRRFKAEARICAMLAHPGIPVVHELRGDYAYVHAPTEGRTLAAVLAEAREALSSRRALPPDATRDGLIHRFLRVCEAVSYAHAHGLIHRDLRPENVVLGSHGATWLVDWGIARRLPGTYSPVSLEPVDEDPRLLIGTPGYCSPEQANGNHAALDGRSDVYALGLLLYEILSLRQAVSGVSPAAKLGRQQLGQIEPLVHAFGAPIPRGLATVVLKALEVHPSDRHPTPEALADDVRRAMRGDDDGWFASAGRAAGRHPAVLLAVGAALGFGWIVAFAALVVPWL